MYDVDSPVCILGLICCYWPENVCVCVFVLIITEGIDQATGSDPFGLGSAMRGQWIPTTSRVNNRKLLHEIREPSLFFLLQSVCCLPYSVCWWSSLRSALTQK